MMKKSEIIPICLGVMLFVITNLLLNDIFGKSNLIITALIGGVSALFSFWWSYKLLPKWNYARKIIFTVCYLVVAISLAVYLPNLREAKLKPQLMGKWISPPNTEGSSELIFEFRQDDSLIVMVDSLRVDLTYKIKSSDILSAVNQTSHQNFEWSILALTNKKLIIGDGEKTMELEKSD